jgi:hypothetical protein
VSPVSAERGRLMKATTAILGALLLALPAVLYSSPREAGNPCAAPLDGWEIIPDTASTVPHFVFESRLQVDRILVCDNGVYFFFRRREWGRYVRFCLVYATPTQAQFAKYVGADEVDIQKRTRKLLEVVAQAKTSYEEFLRGLEGVLGDKYRQNRVLSFEHSRFKPELKMKMGDPIRLTYRGRSVEFLPLMDVYFVPPRDVSGWAVFLLVYTGLAYGR